MSSSTDTLRTHQPDYLNYRSLSVLAVITLMLAILSLPALLFPQLLILPLLGVIVGLCAVTRLRRRYEELTGGRMAWTGLLVSLLVLIGSAGYSGYVYATELPPGYLRISFDELQPDPAYPQSPVPPTALQLNGQHVFVKGYVHPSVDRRQGIRQFVLVPDMKTCCFGGQPKLTDMIEVTLRDPHRINFSYTRRRLGGTLKVTPYKKSVTGLDGVYYQLDADYVN